MATTGAAGTNWTRPQTLAALHIYLQLPFGQLHYRNPKIEQLAGWIGRTPSSVALKLVNLASLDPQIVASGRSGMGNASALDHQIWSELQANWDPLALAAAAEYERLAVAQGVDPDADLLQEAEATEPPPMEPGRTRAALVQVRVNQARFRKAVLASYNATCCVSGLRHEKLVIASHIVPWSQDTHNRLNPQNGLCLSALHDRAYDQGLMTVLPDDFTVRVSPALHARSDDRFIADALLRYDGAPITLPERFRPAPEFLERHAVRFGFMGG
jgi:putative restriction endonuclease